MVSGVSIIGFCGLYNSVLPGCQFYLSFSKGAGLQREKGDSIFKVLRKHERPNGAITRAWKLVRSGGILAGNYSNLVR